MDFVDAWFQFCFFAFQGFGFGLKVVDNDKHGIEENLGE